MDKTTEDKGLSIKPGTNPSDSLCLNKLLEWLMDKTKWPQSWKDQYNQELQRRRIAERIQAQKAAIQDSRNFPQIWTCEISEDNVFPLIAYGFPLHRVLSQLLQRFINNEHLNDLTLSSRYLYHTEKISSNYYSDRERAVAILNRFKNTDEWEELFGWMSLFPQQGYYPQMHFMLGIMFLDRYLSKTTQTIWLQKAIHHLKAVENWVERNDTRKALSAVQALAFT